MRRTVVTLLIISLLLLAPTTLFIGSVSAEAPVLDRGYEDLGTPGVYYPDPWGLDWDITRGDLTVSYTLDMSGFAPAQGNQDWTEIGVFGSGGRTGWMYSGAPGAYMSDTDLLDKNDKLTLNSVFRENEEWSYNATGSETLIADWNIKWKPWLNAGIWFDRGKVDATQYLGGYLNDGQTYNTGGKYDVVVTFHAIDSGKGTMFATVNGIPTGFYNPLIKGEPQYSPVGKVFWGDLTRQQVYAKLMGSGVKISNFKAQGCPTAPSVVGVWPDTAEQGESLKDVIVNGSNFRDVPSTVMLDHNATGESTTASKITYVADFQVRADITIPDNASVGLWDTNFWHNDDTDAVATLPESFKVSYAHPRLNSTDVTHCRPNTSVTMTLTGSHFRKVPLKVQLKRGGEVIEGKNVTWVSANKIKATFAISSTATIANDWAVYFEHTDDGKSSTLYNAFSVDAKININPLDSLNIIWLRCPGILPVVMYSETGFDASTIFPLAVSFGGTFPIYWSYVDMNRDKKKDLVLYFNNMAVNLPVGKNVVSVEAAAWDGRRVTGYNTVRVFKLLF